MCPSWIDAGRRIAAPLALLLLAAALPAQGQTPDERFLAAREAFQRGQVARLDALAAGLPDHPLRPYVLYWQIRAHGPEWSGVAAEFLAAYPDSLLSQRLRADQLRQLGRERNFAAFLAGYRGPPGEDAELDCYALEARIDQGEAAAVAEARAVWLDAGVLPEGCGRLFAGMRQRGVLAEEDLWGRLRSALAGGNTTAARPALNLLGPVHAPRERDLDLVARNPLRYLERHRGNTGTRAERELLLYGIAAAARSAPQAAGRQLERLQARLPMPDRQWASAHVGMACAQKHLPEALDWYRRAGDAPLSDRQLGWQARAALRAGDWETVQHAIARLSPREAALPAWRYWAARAAAALGQAGEARNLYLTLAREHSYHGQLAREELGEVQPDPVVTYRPTQDEIRSLEALPGLERALRLHQLGLRYEATQEWRYAIRGFDDNRLLAAAELASRRGWYERSIDTAERTQVLHDFALRFPAPYRELLHGYAQQLNLDEAWVFGLIRQESRFVVDAHSSAGARGLMQIMPATARWLARRMGLMAGGRDALAGVDGNLSMGTFYLRKLLDALGDHPVLAAAAYNAGIGRAREWRDSRPLEGAVYAETIPFSETRDYVRKVMGNTVYYAKMFGQPAVPLRQRLGVVPARPPVTQ